MTLTLGSVHKIYVSILTYPNTYLQFHAYVACSKKQEEREKEKAAA